MGTDKETDKADTETQDKGPADIKIQYGRPWRI